MQKRAIIYLRTSPHSSDDVDAEIEHLHGIAANLGWTVTTTLHDQADIDVKRRPGLERLRKLVAAGHVDMVITPSLTAIAGSVDDLVTFVVGLQASACGLYAHDESIDTTTPGGTAWMNGMVIAAEFRAKLRRQRVQEGVARARIAGVKFGRACVPTTTLKLVRKHLEAGLGIRPVARLTGISPARVLQERNLMLIEQDSGKLAA
jgi:DNA invertase Pin-like site-specific DNA recombinase